MPGRTLPPRFMTGGERVVVGDVNGTEMEIVCQEDQKVLDFIDAYRELMELTMMPMKVSDATMEYANRKVQRAYNFLPGRVFIEIDRRKADAASG